jgi:hypothetical protein
MTFAIQQGIARLLLYASLAHGALMAQTPQISWMAVSTAEELIAATQNKKVSEINISADLTDLSPLRLMPGQTLRSASDRRAVLSFRTEADGLEVTTDNSVFDLDVRVAPTHRAIWNARTVDSLGTLVIRSVRTIGSVQIIATDKVRSGRIEVDGLDIRSADTRGERERPHEYGVSVLQGAFTLWNLQSDEKVAISADLVNLSTGQFGPPVLGTGIFVAGAGKRGGRLNVERLETNAVYSDGRIMPGTADQIAGGIFVVYGTYVESVRNLGPTITYGANDMALENWGSVDRWVSKGKVATYGESGVGFVNFGSIRDLCLLEPIETFGPGARGFNVYDGTISNAEFDRIVTHGNGAVGVQISQPIGTLVVRRGIETFGGTGPSLVKGVVQKLSATALSVKPGGSADLISVNGNIETHGHGILPIEILGSIRSLHIHGVSFRNP